MNNNQARSEAFEKEIDRIVSEMTLEEKVGQLTQIGIDQVGYERTLELIRQGMVGSIIRPPTAFAGTDNPYLISIERSNELQRIAVEESRMGIPILYGRDVIHGYHTTFPIPLAQAASWDLELVEQAAAIAAQEAAREGVLWTFAPMLDIARDPRWGRIIEGCGEDPYLASRMAGALVKGYQGDPLGQPGRIAACAKHFVGYGASEGGRDYNSTDIPEYSLRNVYLPSFKAAVEAGVNTVMSSFNDISGVPVTSNHALLTDILKDEYRFEGFVISDWESILQLINQGVARDRKEAAEQAFNAGLDMDMIDCCYLDHIADLVGEGKVSMQRLDDAVRRVLRVKFQVGLMAQPYTQPFEQSQTRTTPEQLRCARSLAARGMILLKNEDSILPLHKEGQRIALIGPFAAARDPHLGAWACDGHERDVVSIVEGIRLAAPGAKVMTTSNLVDDMLSLARRADVVVLALGESRGRSGEAQSVAEIELSRDQEELLKAVHVFNPNIVSVICAGRPLSMLTVEKYSSAILYAWHSGIQAGSAIADVLFGDVNPSGKLPVSFPVSSGQIPIYYNHRNTGRFIDEYYGSNTFVNYQDLPGKPCYAFGYGLSYTQFQYDALAIDRQQITPGEAVNVSVQITNTGKRAGEEVVQCYLSDLVASAIRPVKELKGFARVKLEAGESQIASFNLGEKEMGFYNPAGEWILEPGEFKVSIGSSCLAEESMVFEVVRENE